MVEMLQAKAVAAGDFSLLAYAEHMAETARSGAAKHMFEAYVEQERQRLQRLVVAGYGAADTEFAPKGLSAAPWNGGHTRRKRTKRTEEEA